MIPTSYLNQLVSVRVDRPMNSRHPKYDFLYPVNYGYVPNTVSGDGEELDAYILGVKTPLSEFQGRCIAIIHRQNDDDDKLIVVPDGTEFSDTEIEDLTEFQEKWFRHSIVRNPCVTRTHTGVYGIIRQGNKLLLIKKARGPYTGLYDLPGGGPESEETPEQTLAREIKEETGCTLSQAANRRTRTIFFSDFTPASGEKGCLQHTGVLFDATIQGVPTTAGDGLDSNGAEWVDMESLTSRNATPFALMGAGKEVIALANENGYPVDVGIRRHPRPDNRYPMIAAVFLFNTAGQLILHRISFNKKVDPGKWSYSAAGHIDAGESAAQAAVRELREELGISADLASDYGQIPTFQDGKIRAFHHAFRVVSDDIPHPDPTEIAEVRAFSPDELRLLTQEQPHLFKDAFLTFFRKIFP